MANTARQANKTAGKSAGRPFAKGSDPRRGVGKKGRSGRKPDWLKQQMHECREKAVAKIAKKLNAKTEELDPDQLIKVVEKFAPPGERPDSVVWFFPVLAKQSIEEWAKGQPGILGR